jgi:site-specific DNA recombinase
MGTANSERGWALTGTDAYAVPASRAGNLSAVPALGASAVDRVAAGRVIRGTPFFPDGPDGIGYYRQSKNDPDGIERQREKVRDMFAAMGVNLLAEYEDNEVSATKGRRWRGYAQARAHMAKLRKGSYLGVSKMARLYRKSRELEDLIDEVEKTGVLVKSAEGTYDLSTAHGRMIAKQLVAIAQAEVEEKADRQKDASLQDARQGKRNTSGCRPFGYCADRVTPMDAGVPLAAVNGTRKQPVPTLDGPGWRSDEPWAEVAARVAETAYDADGRVVTAESEADAVRDGIDTVLRGGSITGITRRWWILGLRPPLAPFGPLSDGNPWNHRSVKRILTNPQIAGLRTYNGRVVATGDWTPLVIAEKWESAQVILTDPGRRKGSGGALSLLGGVALCRCGAVVKHAVRRKRGYLPCGLYRCSAYEKEGFAKSGPHVATKSDPIDRFVTNVLLEVLERPDAVDMFADPGAEVDIGALKDQLGILDKALTKLSLQNSMDLIPDSVFTVNAAQISAEQEAINARIAEASRVNVAALLVALADVRATWEGMDISEQRAVFRALTRITLKPAGCGCRKPDFDKLIHIGWKVPHKAA